MQTKSSRQYYARNANADDFISHDEFKEIKFDPYDSNSPDFGPRIERYISLLLQVDGQKSQTDQSEFKINGNDQQE